MSQKIVYHSNGLYIRTTIARKSSYVSIPVKCEFHEWSNDVELVNKHHPYQKQINTYLIDLKHKLYEVYTQIIKDRMSAQIAAKYIQAALFEVKQSHTFTNLVKQLSSEHLVEHDPASSAWIITAHAQVCKFLGKSEIDFADINYINLLAFRKHKEHNGLKPNSINNYMRAIRSVYNQGVDRELYEPKVNPFKRGLIPSIVKQPVRNISANDIAKLEHYNAPTKHEQFAIDVWLLGFYLCGADFIDVANLKRSSVQGNYICFNRSKTGQPVKVFMHDKIKNILGKYSTSINYLLPIINKPIVTSTDLATYKTKLKRQNSRTKAIAALIGINGEITSKWLRHSWITIAKHNYIDEDIRKQCVGHRATSGAHAFYAGDYPQHIIDAANELVCGLINIEQYYTILKAQSRARIL